MFHINCCWLSVELDGITLPLFLVKTLNIGLSLDCFIMFHLSIAVIKVYATLFIAAVHFHDRPSKFFFSTPQAFKYKLWEWGLWVHTIT